MQQAAERTLAGVECDNVALNKTVRELTARCEDQENTIRVLKSERQALLMRLFGRRSEKVDPTQVGLFRDELLTEAVGELETELAAKTGADAEHETPPAKSERNGRRRPPADLRRDRRQYTLAECDRLCPCCRVPMQAFGEDVTEQLEYMPASLFVIEHARTKYACRGCEQGVAIAVMPAQPIEKGLPGPGLLAHVALSKYGHHLPLYRLESIFAEQGVPVSRKTMCDWVAATAAMLAPIVAEQKRRMLQEPLLQSDDTHVQYQDRTRKGRTSRGFLWSYTIPWAEVVYDFTTTRSRSAPRDFLGHYKGHLQADGYAGYISLFPNRPDATIGCLAHVRRKFFEARLEDKDRAGTVLAAIQRIYRVERRAKAEKLSGEALVAVRLVEVMPILIELGLCFEALAALVLPKSMLGRAVGYAIGQWPAIKRYAAVAQAEAGNNSCEQTMRVPVLGRKNWMFAGSVEGGKRGAILFSLIVTCKRLGINPAEYLVDVITRVATHPNARIGELTPRGWKELREQTAGQA